MTNSTTSPADESESTSESENDHEQAEDIGGVLPFDLPKLTPRRRQYITTAGSISGTLLSGCLTFGSNDDGGNGNAPTSPDDTTPDSGTQTRPNESQEQSSTDTASDSREHNESTNESDDNDSDDERPSHPPEEKTEPDRSQYNESQTAIETKPLPSETIDVTGRISETGRIYTASGQITNVSETHVDIVEIEVVWKDANGNPVGTSITVVHDIPPGESERFKSTIPHDHLSGTPISIDGEAFPHQKVK